MYQLVARLASLAGLRIVCAFCLDQLKSAAGEAGTAAVIFANTECYEILITAADLPAHLPNAGLILVTEEDFERVCRFVAESQAIAAQCWNAVQREIAKSTASGSRPPLSISYLTMDQIEKQTLVAAVMENPLLSPRRSV
jgi:hypothetical protein